MIEMDKYIRHIVEDLLPLYQEGLLSNETKEWLEKQIAENEEFQTLVLNLQTPIIKEEIETTETLDMKREKMFKKIHRRLAFYQIIFVAISFLFAIQTSLLNESFGFILSYTVLGLLVYLFYSDMKIVFFISFIPIFLWVLVEGISSFLAGPIDENVSTITYGFRVLQTAIVNSVLHYLFAFIGSIIGLLIKKLRGDTNE